YTSGTTGRPKGAVLTHLNLHVQAVTIICAWGSASSEEISLGAAPLFHIAGVGTIAPMMLLGSTMVIHPTGLFSASDILDVMERERISVVFLVPTQWQAVCAEPTVTVRDLALRVISWGAAPASDTLLRRMAEVFPDATNIAVFGQTEMSPVTCVLDGADALRKLGSVGKPISTLSVRVVDADLNDVAQGDVGEIVYRGPTTMAGYWRNPEATAAAFDGGWFHSGDLVRRDDEGFFYVVDRKKDMIISGGENIYCAEVENALAAHPGIVEVAVIGRPHERWGETPVAVLVPVDGVEPPTAAGLGQWLQDKLASYKKPTEVVVLEELPRNASGKVVKHVLRTTYGR
ncbi:MAG: AMP-binding protein, partial [Mycobacteriaceae bacterium]